MLSPSVHRQIDLHDPFTDRPRSMPVLDGAWLTVREAVPLVQTITRHPEHKARAIRRWIAAETLPARKANTAELAALVAAGRVRGIPPDGTIYLIHRSDLAHGMPPRRRTGARTRKQAR